MIDLAATITAMKEADMDDASIVAALACLRLNCQSDAKPTARQLRNRRYYEKHASEKRLKASEQDVSDADAPSPKESPQTPKETPPSLPTTPKEKTPKGVQKKAVRLPADWVLPDEWRAEAIAAGLPPGRADLEGEKMRDWSLSAPAGAKRDWHAAWRNWYRGALDRLPHNRAPPPSRSAPSMADVFEFAARTRPDERPAEDFRGARTALPHLSVAGEG